MRMLEDGSGNWYDPNFYRVADDPAVMPAFPNINTITTKTYRRVYKNLQVVAAPGKYTADSIQATAAVWDPANALTSNARETCSSSTTRATTLPSRVCLPRSRKMEAARSGGD